MKTKWLKPLLICVGAFALTPTVAVFGQFTETFDGGFHLTWNTDRFAPNIWTTVPDFTGAGKGDILKLGVNSDDHQSGFLDYDRIGFYNTQGKQTSLSSSGPWEATAQLYVSAQMLTGTYDWRTDFWARNSASGLESDASYWIIGASNIVLGPADDPFRVASFEVWTGTAGWQGIGLPISSPGWYDLFIGTDGSTVSLGVNGVTDYSEALMSAAGLTTLYVQGANLPPATSPSSDHRENYYWNDVDLALIPETPALAFLAGIGALGFVVFMRISRRASSAYVGVT